MDNLWSRAGVIACAIFLSYSTTSALAGSEALLVSVSCDKFQRTGNTIRVNEDTSVVDVNWDGYSLHADQRIAGAAAVGRDEKLFRMIVEACKL